MLSDIWDRGTSICLTFVKRAVQKRFNALALVPLDNEEVEITASSIFIRKLLFDPASFNRRIVPLKLSHFQLFGLKWTFPWNFTVDSARLFFNFGTKSTFDPESLENWKSTDEDEDENDILDDLDSCHDGINYDRQSQHDTESENETPMHTKEGQRTVAHDAFFADLIASLSELISNAIQNANGACAKFHITICLENDQCVHVLLQDVSFVFNVTVDGVLAECQILKMTLKPDDPSSKCFLRLNRVKVASKWTDASSSLDFTIGSMKIQHSEELVALLKRSFDVPESSASSQSSEADPASCRSEHEDSIDNEDSASKSSPPSYNLKNYFRRGFDRVMGNGRASTASGLNEFAEYEEISSIFEENIGNEPSVDSGLVHRLIANETELKEYLNTLEKREEEEQAGLQGDFLRLVNNLVAARSVSEFFEAAPALELSIRLRSGKISSQFMEDEKPLLDVQFENLEAKKNVGILVYPSVRGRNLLWELVGPVLEHT